MSNQDIPQNAFKRSENGNSLWNYVQSLSPEAIAHLSQPESKEVFQIIEHNISGLLGSVPHESFDVEISTKQRKFRQTVSICHDERLFSTQCRTKNGF